MAIRAAINGSEKSKIFGTLIATGFFNTNHNNKMRCLI